MASARGIAEESLALTTRKRISAGQSRKEVGMRLRGKQWFMISLAILVLLWIALLASDTRVLIWETKVQKGQRYNVEGYGEITGDGQEKLIGYYFNGRKIVRQVFWYSPNNIL